MNSKLFNSSSKAEAKKERHSDQSFKSVQQFDLDKNAKSERYNQENKQSVQDGRSSTNSNLPIKKDQQSADALTFQNYESWMEKHLEELEINDLDHSMVQIKRDSWESPNKSFQNIAVNESGLWSECK